MIEKVLMHVLAVAVVSCVLMLLLTIVGVSVQFWQAVVVIVISGFIKAGLKEALIVLERDGK